MRGAVVPADRLAAIATELVERGSGPTGAVLRLVREDRELVDVAVGARQTHDGERALTSPLAMTRDTVFDVGSVTKVAVTTCLVMRLHDAGVLDIDDPVARWFPPFRERPKADVTVRDLLAHRAGLWEWWPTYAFAQNPADALGYVAALPLRYRPRTGRHYSDLGFMLLGGILEQLTGAGIAELARGELVDPLELGHTGFGVAPGAPVAASSHGDRYEQRMLATGEPYPVGVDQRSFAGWRRHTLVGEVNDGNAFHAFGGVAGHAGLFTTATDLSRLGLALVASLRGEGPWSADTARLFTTPGEDPGQALGFRTWQVVGEGNEERVVGHSGFPGAEFALLPDAGLVAVLLANRLHTPGPIAPITSWWQRILTAIVENSEELERAL